MNRAWELGLFEIEWGGSLKMIQTLQDCVGRIGSSFMVPVTQQVTLITDHRSALNEHLEVAGAAKDQSGILTNMMVLGSH
jgi:hypothetical protein